MADHPQRSIPIARHLQRPGAAYREQREEGLRRTGERQQAVRRLMELPVLTKKRQVLLAVQKHLMTTRKPHIGEKEAQRLGKCLNVPADFFLIEPKALTQTRVDRELARVEAELVRLNA